MSQKLPWICFRKLTSKLHHLTWIKFDLSKCFSLLNVHFSDDCWMETNRFWFLGYLSSWSHENHRCEYIDLIIVNITNHQIWEKFKFSSWQHIQMVFSVPKFWHHYSSAYLGNKYLNMDIFSDNLWQLPPVCRKNWENSREEQLLWCG